MRSNQFKYIALSILISISASSCKIKEMQAKQKSLEDENSRLKNENREMSVKNNELNANLGDLDKKNRDLANDTAECGNKYRNLLESNNSLNRNYRDLLESTEKLKIGNEAESKVLIGKLQKTQDDLQLKEDVLGKLASELNAKEKSLNTANTELKKREIKLKELQGILHRKDSTVAALRKTVADALLGFKDNGLTVEQRNGKVYVSLEERLLFASGSTEVDKKGAEAIKQLAKVLDKNTDINVLIEGHTDNVPIATSTIKDNWDLSTMRATAIVRIVTNGSKIDAKRLTAAGRSQYVPIDAVNTAEARKKNRRTEIILTPKLDELFKVLESN